MAEDPKKTGVPVTWPELVSERSRAARSELDHLRELPAMLTSRPPRGVSMTLGSAADSLSEAEILLGPDECRPLLAELQNHFARALDEFEKGIPKGSEVRATGLLNYLNASLCCGDSTPVRDGLEADWIRQISGGRSNLTESESSNLAFAALATASVDLVPVFIGGKDELEKFTPGGTFGLNVQGFVRYIAAGIKSGAAPEDVEPAWQEFLDNFPRKFAADALTWVDLLWAGRAMMVQIEKRPVETTGGSLHDLLT